MWNNLMCMLVLGGVCAHAQDRAEAICKIDSDSGSDDEHVEGIIVFRATETGVDIDIDLEGFDTYDDDTMHGFHIHRDGDLTDGCRGAGPHYNPHDMDHGYPTNRDRHVGDLGNIEEDDEGEVHTVIHDRSGLIEFEGEHGIMGRAIVVHEGEDDMGEGGEDDSLTTGHAGGRLACCIIKQIEPSGATMLRAGAMWFFMVVMVIVLN